MVSTITFEKAVDIHATFLTTIGENGAEAESRILGFLDWDAPDKEVFGTETRIILVSADFGKELTTSVLWLRNQSLDIKCVRMKPYRDGDRTLIDVRQIIPLPEASEYQVQLLEKKSEVRKQRSERHDLRQRFWDGVVGWAKKKGGRHAHLKTGSYTWIGAGSGIGGLGWNLGVKQQSSKAELYIDRGSREENKSIFDRLLEHRAEIEASFPFPLEWQRLEGRRASRIATVIQGGYRTPEAEWPAIQEAMVDRIGLLEKVLRPFLETLKL